MAAVSAFILQADGNREGPSTRDLRAEVFTQPRPNPAVAEDGLEGLSWAERRRCATARSGSRIPRPRRPSKSGRAEDGRPAMRILVFGTGGAAGFFGAQLANAGEDVVLIARGEHLKAI